MSWLNTNLPEGAARSIVKSGANNVKYSWNKVVQDFLASKSDWLWSTHNDVVYVPDTLNRLLSWDKPLISALVFMRNGPPLPHIWNKPSDQPEEYQERIKNTVDWFYAHQDYIRFGPFVMEPKPEDALKLSYFTSTSCTLIHRSVLEAMRPIVKDEWFLWDNDYTGGGEDRRFFENARLAGFDNYVDRSCVCGHLAGDIPTSAADFIAWSDIIEFQLPQPKA